MSPLIVILISVGAAYTLFTSAPSPVRQFELTAVWGTLGFIALALTSKVSPGLGLVIAAVMAAPLWYLSSTVSKQCAQADEKEAGELWRQWQAKTGTRSALDSSSLDSSSLDSSSLDSASSDSSSLAARVNQHGHGDVAAEIVNLQPPAAIFGQETAEPTFSLALAPIDKPMYSRGRV